MVDLPEWRESARPFHLAMQTAVHTPLTPRPGRGAVELYRNGAHGPAPNRRTTDKWEVRGLKVTASVLGFCCWL